MSIRYRYLFILQIVSIREHLGFTLNIVKYVTFMRLSRSIQFSCAFPLKYGKQKKIYHGNDT